MKKQLTDTTGQIWDRLPLWAKGLVIGIGGFVVYKIAKNVLDKSRLNEQARDSAQELDGWNKDFLQIMKVQKPTLSPTQMKSIANVIENSLDGYGTRDEEILRQAKRINNDADLAGVAVAFGVRTIEAGRGIGWLAGHERGTLSQVIREADDSTLAEINKHFESKGIKYRL